MKMNFKTLIITAIFCILTKEISSQYDYSNSNSYVATNDNTSNSYQNLPDYYQPEAKDQNYDDDVMKKVLNKYNKEVRPIKKIVIKLKVSLRQIVSVDEKNQIMTSNIYVSAVWTDGRLRWNPLEDVNGSYVYGNLTEIVVPTSKLWIPDLFVINTAGTNGFIPISSSNLALVNYKGQVYLLISVTNLQTRCKMNVYYFPFDKQNCSIVLGSWIHDTERINFETTVSKIDLDNYVPSPIWTLRTVVVNSIFGKDRFLGNSGLLTEDIAYYFTISRGSGYYMGNLVACFILNVVTLLAYFLPFATQVTLCMTSFLTFAVQSLNINNFLPVQSLYFPLISVYFMCSIFCTFFSLIWFWNLNNFTTKKVPKFLEPIAKLMKLILFCLFPKNDKQDNKVKSNEIIISDLEPKGKVAIVSSSASEQQKCSKCSIDCMKCKADKEKEDAKKKTKEVNDSNCIALNYLVFFIVFIILAFVNAVVWLSCAFS